jgi:hypothetical protein
MFTLPTLKSYDGHSSAVLVLSTKDGFPSLQGTIVVPDGERNINLDNCGKGCQYIVPGSGVTRIRVFQTNCL